MNKSEWLKNTGDRINGCDQNIVVVSPVAARAMVERILNAALEALIEGLKKDGEVCITGFGRFFIQKSAQRKGRNPRTGDEMIMPAGEKVAFRPGIMFK